MRCPLCSFTNVDGTRFCGGCGVGLERVCERCGTANSPASRFCGGCGASIGASGPSDVVGVARDAAAERRQLTIMFCDLLGYTTLSTQLDPEDMRDVIRRYQSLVSEEVRRYDGVVASFSGDGVMAYFGYPRAHEDDAERAIHAGLEIVESVRKIEASASAGFLSARLGIATGEVVVGDLIGGGISDRWAVTGETPNLASRLQSIAEPNTVVVSASTQRLAGGAFDYVHLGQRELKGIPTKVDVWSVTGRRATASRFDAARGRTLTPMVGREPELTLIDLRWQLATAGRGQVVVLRGDGGIGKSRITQFFWERLAHLPHQRLQFQCSPYHANSALHPVITQIEQAAKFSLDDDDRRKCAKLEALFEFSPAERDIEVPLIASLLSIPYQDLYPKLTLEPGRQRERTLQAMLTRIHRLSSRAPLLCVVEDVHWIDPSTLELLHDVVRSVAGRAILMIVTSRPGFVAPWAASECVVELPLERLPERQVQEIVTGVTAGKSLPAEVMSQIVAKADGVPLFAEELTKTVLDSGLLAESDEHYSLLRTFRNLAIPTTLHDSLMARLDRLPQEKTVANIAAVIGRSFGYDLLKTVSGLPDDELTHALDRLQGAELIQQRQAAPARTFEFRHALIQDAAYQSQLKSARRANHEKIARAIETSFPYIASTQPEVVAHHYGEAESIEPALRNWQAAGVRAIERSSNVEALRHLDEALRLLPQLQSVEQRARQELQVQLARGIMLTAVEGYASPSVELAYGRALTLCEEVGDGQQKFGALFGLWAFSMVGGRLPAAIQRGHQLLALADGSANATSLMLAHRGLGTTYLLIGDLVAAREHTMLGFRLYDRAQHAALAFRIGHDPCVAMGVYRGWTLWLLGYGDEALAASRAALHLARDLEHPVSVAFALCYLAIVEVHCGEFVEARDHADEAAVLSREHRLALWGALSGIIRGWSLIGLGDNEVGIDVLRDGVDAWMRTGARAGVSFYRSAQACALLACGRAAEALRVVDEGMAAAEENGEYFFHAELLRLSAEALAATSPRDATKCEALYREALAVARRQRARAFELRIALGLGRFLVEEDRRGEALALVESITGWFTQGLETVDLVAARRLLDELRAPSHVAYSR